MLIKLYLRLMRPAHWIKNLLVIFPLVFSGRMWQIDATIQALAAFLVFSLAASAVYELNDIMDVEKDRLHPTKRNRPIASGEVSVFRAWMLFAALLLAALVVQLLSGELPAGGIVLLYVAANIAYSARLKRVPVVDVVFLSAGYLMRVFYGGAMCGVAISGWLYLTILAASFYLGLGKRRGEFVSQGVSTRAVLKGYSYEFLDKNMYMFLGLANVFYALWARTASDGMLFTVPIVMVMSMQYSLDVERDSEGDPMTVILTDKMLLITALVYAVSVIAILYLARRF